MTVPKNALLLVGSPRVNSTSEILGAYLIDRLRGKGFETERVRIYPSMKTDKGCKDLLSSVDHSDILILAFPLYVDSLPSLVTKALEMISEHRESQENPKRHQFVAISNCGFPEAYQNDTALAISRRFAREKEMQWVGSLGVGGGEPIGLLSKLLGGKPLEKLGVISRNEKKSLDLMAEFLSTGRAMSQEVMELRTNRPMPKWLYVLAGTVLFIWRRKARKNKVRGSIYDRPYQVRQNRDS
jgi:multimeric flavodoxin WrbA